jgi:uncharacterized protein (TIGR02270 family)
VAGRKVVETVIFQHAEDASFLWGIRQQALVAPHYLLADLVKLDDRLEGHLDGLLIAGDAGWALCIQQLQRGEPGAYFAAGVLALQGDSPGRFMAVVERAAADPAAARALIAAIAWLEPARTSALVKKLSGGGLTERRIALAAAANIGAVAALDLTTAAHDGWAPLRARALRAIGEAKVADLWSDVHRGLSDQSAGCRFWAARSALLLGHKEGLAGLGEAAAAADPWAKAARDLMARSLPLPEALAWHRALVIQSRRSALEAIGATGCPQAMPSVLEAMTSPALARLAGEAFTSITGVNLAEAGLEGDAPPDHSAGPTDDPADEDVAMDPDEHLPWPLPARVAEYWGKHQDRFRASERYLLGKPLTEVGLNEALRLGAQRHRAAAALELGLKQKAEPLFNVRARGREQVRRLAVDPGRGAVKPQRPGRPR